ncbi:DJ-1/PfpI family protein [Kineococcus glutinatus]|uniref:DJ-1/PfpI family protein n=1 Tax=Kineococcus glutinatus TaxID=1070872 RepID=A0ABP8VCY6_9ACTN
MRAEIVVFDGFEDLDATGPLNVLGIAGFDVGLVTAAPRDLVVSALGTRVVPAGTLSGAADVVVVPGGGWLDRGGAGAWAEAQRGELPRALAGAAAGGAVLASVCTGALLLGAAGLLEDRPAVTNAAALDDLAATGALVDAAARVVDDGAIVTSGGLTAGIDLALRLVERFCGAVRAREVARELEYPGVGGVRRPLAESPDVLAAVAEL